MVYDLPRAAEARISLFDTAGRRIARRALGRRAAGSHVATLDAEGLAPGVYWLSLRAGGDRHHQRVVLVR